MAAIGLRAKAELEPTPDPFGQGCGDRSRLADLTSRARARWLGLLLVSGLAESDLRRCRRRSCAIACNPRHNMRFHFSNKPLDHLSCPRQNRDPARDLRLVGIAILVTFVPRTQKIDQVAYFSIGVICANKLMTSAFLVESLNAMSSRTGTRRIKPTGKQASLERQLHRVRVQKISGVPDQKLLSTFDTQQ
jgi:hypothetical protein